MIMTATLKATAAIAMRMIKEENDLDLLKAILRTIKSSVFNAVGDVYMDKDKRIHGTRMTRIKRIYKMILHRCYFCSSFAFFEPCPHLLE